DRRSHAAEAPQDQEGRRPGLHPRPGAADAGPPGHPGGGSRRPGAPRRPARRGRPRGHARSRPMITMSDFFCGAGGSSTGAVQVPGVRVELAANHWRLAVETHNTNHPDARHDIADLSQVDPRRYPKTDIAWLSPSCTNHSIAKGARRATQDSTLFGAPDAAAERSRATMWDVVRFAEYHRYRYLLVENVVDAREWVLWPAWSSALTALGYEYRVVSRNSMHAQALGPAAPQSRDRLYVVAWRRGETAPDLNRWARPMADCPQHGRVRAIQAWRREGRTVGKYKSQYTWRCPRVECRNIEVHPAVRPAADIIDWSLPVTRIADQIGRASC